MNKLILEPTVTSQWYSLVLEAEQLCSLHLSEDLESYLVFLLSRFINQAELANSVLAVDFLESLHKAGRAQHEQLRDVGDKCLLFAGLFPNRAIKKQVKISYFVDLGKNAYGILADLSHKQIADLYAALQDDFVPLMDVLQATREVAGQSPQLLPLEAIELWQSTGSQHALKIARDYHSGLVLYGHDDTQH